MSHDYAAIHDQSAGVRRGIPPAALVPLGSVETSSSATQFRLMVRLQY